MSPKRAERRADPVVPVQGRLMPSDPLHPVTASREETVRRMAYERYQKRGGQDGRAQEDWFAAEASYHESFGS